MAKKSFLNISVKIFFLTFVFVGIFQVGSFTLKSMQNEQEASESLVVNQENNAARFQSAYSSQF